MKKYDVRSMRYEFIDSAGECASRDKKDKRAAHDKNDFIPFIYFILPRSGRVEEPADQRNALGKCGRRTTDVSTSFDMTAGVPPTGETINWNRKQVLDISGSINRNRKQGSDISGNINRNRKQVLDISGSINRNRKQVLDISGSINRNWKQVLDISGSINRTFWLKKMA